MTYWNSFEGLIKISTFADGIGPSMKQLVDIDPETKKITPTKFYHNAKDLNLLIHVYTLNVDRLPTFAFDYRHLLEIFTRDVKVDGVFTDFPDLTIRSIAKLENSSNRLLTTNFATYLISLICFICVISIY